MNEDDYADYNNSVDEHERLGEEQSQLLEDAGMSDADPVKQAEWLENYYEQERAREDYEYDRQRWESEHGK